MASQSPTPVSDRISVLDQFRGVAILTVFLYHCVIFSFYPTWLNWSGAFRNWDIPRSFLAVLPLCLGWAGVAIFFVVSGFCIRLAHMKSARAGWRVFAWRRFWRIYPPYLVAVLGFAFFYRYTRLRFDGPHHGLFDWAQLGSHLLLIHNVDLRSFYGINGAFWSIAVEAQIYLLYPLLHWMAGRWGWRRTIGLIGAIEISLRLAMTAAGEEAPTGLMAVGAVPCWLAGSPFVYWFGWAIGAWLADAKLRGVALPFARQPIWIWMALFAVSYFFRPLIAFSFLFAAMATVVTLARMLDRQTTGALGRMTGRSFRAWLGDGLAMVGAVSYSMYLLHQPMLSAVQPIMRKFLPALAGRPQFVFPATLAMGVVVAASVVFYRGVEQPSIWIGKKLFASREVGAASLQPTPP